MISRKIDKLIENHIEQKALTKREFYIPGKLKTLASAF
jgi:hypothetical protein